MKSCNKCLHYAHRYEDVWDCLCSLPAAYEDKEKSSYTDISCAEVCEHYCDQGGRFSVCCGAEIVSICGFGYLTCEHCDLDNMWCFSQKQCNSCGKIYNKPAASKYFGLKVGLVRDLTFSPTWEEFYTTGCRI